MVRTVATGDAYVNAQTGGTQLVTTQKKYLDAEWAAALERHGDARLVSRRGANRSPSLIRGSRLSSA